MDPHEVIDAVAERLFRSFERNDPAGVSDCCAPGAVFVRNGRRQGVIEELAPGFATLHERIGWHRYSDVRRSVFDGGFVEEHLVESDLPNGERLSSMVCVVASVDGEGRVTELREYAPARSRPPG